MAPRHWHFDLNPFTGAVHHFPIGCWAAIHAIWDYRKVLISSFWIRIPIGLLTCRRRLRCPWKMNWFGVHRSYRFCNSGDSMVMGNWTLLAAGFYLDGLLLGYVTRIDLENYSNWTFEILNWFSLRNKLQLIHCSPGLCYYDGTGYY